MLEEAPRRGLRLVTASEALELAEPVERPLAASSWGSGKDLSTWDSARVAEFAFAARAAELRIVAAAGGAGAAPALARAARELLAMQASDWSFMDTRELAGDYPRERLDGAPLRASTRRSPLCQTHGPRRTRDLRDLAPHLDLASLTTP